MDDSAGNIERIKNFIPRDGERYIFIENGKPLFVIMSFRDYERNFGDGDVAKTGYLSKTRNPVFSPAKNSESKNETEKEAAEPETDADIDKELKIEDLPF